MTFPFTALFKLTFALHHVQNIVCRCTLKRCVANM